jgi:hypothetical protein
VKTVPKLTDRGYAPQARLRRRPDAWGDIVGHSDGHGLCYEVRHSDGTRAFYDPDELLDEEGHPLSNKVLAHEVMMT